MKVNQKIFLIFIFLFVNANSIIWSQSNIKKGFKFGVEFKNYLTEETGAFNKTLYFTFGGFTGINIYSYPKGGLLIKTELNYLRLHYFTRDKYTDGVDSSDINWNGLNYTVYEARFSFGIIELAILPAYHMNINEKISLDYFVGPSFGLGNKELETIHLDKNKLLYYPYDDLTWGFGGVVSMNVGLSFFYKSIVVDIRYKYTTIQGPHEFSNMYVQLGIAL